MSSPKNRRGSLLKSDGEKHRKVDAADFPRGTLEKLSSGLMKQWQKRWFAFSSIDRCLRYWPTAAEPKPNVLSKGCVSLSPDIKITSVPPRVIHLEEEETERVLKLRCVNQAEADEWLAALEGATTRKRVLSNAAEHIQEAQINDASSPTQPVSPPQPAPVEDQPYLYDAFISYRVDADKHVAAVMFHMLEKEGLRIFWDKQCLKVGEDWEVGFTQGLKRSRRAILLVSSDAVKNIVENAVTKQDNMLKEWELAVTKLRTDSSYLVPILIGDYLEIDGDRLFRKFGAFGGLRDNPWPTQCSTTCKDRTIKETMDQLFKINGIFLDPENIEAARVPLVKAIGQVAPGDASPGATDPGPRMHEENEEKQTPTPTHKEEAEDEGRVQAQAKKADEAGKIKHARPVIVISYEGSIDGFDEKKVIQRIMSVVENIQPESIRFDPVPEGYTHRAPKTVRLDDADARPVEVFIDENEYVSLSEAESSSSSGEGSSSDGASSADDCIDKAERLLPIFISLGHQVKEDDIGVRFFKQGSVVVCLQMPAMAAVLLKLGRHRLPQEMRDMDVHVCNEEQGESDTIWQETITVTLVDNSTGEVADPFASFGKERLETAVRAVLGAQFGRCGIHLSNFGKRLLVRVSAEKRQRPEPVRLDIFESPLDAIHRVERGAAAGPLPLHGEDSATADTPALLMPIALLNQLRDLVLIGDFEKKLSAALFGTAPAAAGRGAAAAGSGAAAAGAPPSARTHTLSVDRSRFVRMYETHILRLEDLTPHQRRVAGQCRSGRSRVVHIDAPAGTGKTFIALHLVMDRLVRAGAGARMLFVTRSPALAFYFVRWLCVRMEADVLSPTTTTAAAAAARPRQQYDQQQRAAVLRKLHILYGRGGADMDMQLMELRCRGGLLEGVRVSAAERRAAYDTVIVDEAHTVYSHARCAAAVGEYVGKDTRLLLLSDLSQCATPEAGIAFPAGAHRVTMTEVVRCTERLVAGAMAFQLGESTTTECHSQSVGPPLKSFLFAAGGSYVDHVVQALQHIRASFPDLSLHDRVVILVPDERFRQQLESDLTRDLAAIAANASGSGNRISLVGAETAARVLTDRRRSRPTAADGSEWIVLDTVDNFNGLERLIVIAVGLDSNSTSTDSSGSSGGSDSSDIDSAAAALEARSRLYRAITRAHLLAVVVNEHVSGGWLEWLSTVELKDGEFNGKHELQQHNPGSTQRMVAQVEQQKRLLTQQQTQLDRLGNDNNQESQSPEGSEQEGREDAAKLGGEVVGGKDRKLGHTPIKQGTWDTTSNAEDLRTVPTTLKFMPVKDKSGKIMLSGRFDGDHKEAVIRGVGERLRAAIGVENVLLVKAGAGEDFGRIHHIHMEKMDVMVAFAFEDYGMKTQSVYCSYNEVKYAHEHEIPIIPLKLYDGNWPPVPVRPDGTRDTEGEVQNAFVFSPSKVYKEFKLPFDDPKLQEIADCIAMVAFAFEDRAKDRAK